MEQAITRFLDQLHVERGFSPNTVVAYRNDLQQLLSFLQSRLPDRPATSNGPALSPWDPWSAVNRGVLQAYVATLYDRRYAETTVARKIASVKSFFHFLHSDKRVPSNPTEGLTSPGVRRALPKTISVIEVDELLEQPLKRDTPEARRDRAMLTLLYATGLRVTELVKLNVEDLILDRNYPYVRCLGRVSRPRLIPLPAEALEPLREYLSNARDRLVRREEVTALFLNRRGEGLTRQGFWLILKGYAKAANLQAAITPHILRHSFATHVLRSGRLNLRELQEFLGHASITTTQVYAHILGSTNQSGVLDAAPPRGH